jgi:TP901 family phage tail tape measure protein
MVTNPLGSERSIQIAIEGKDEISGTLDSVAQNLDGLRSKAGLAGLAIAGLGTALAVDAVNSASEFESALTDLQKVAGSGVASSLEDDIQQMAEEIPLTANELAGLATDAARFGVEGEDNILRFVEATSKMSTATTLNTDQAAQAFAKLATLTDTPIGQIENLGSSINSLSNNFAASSQEITNASLRSAGALSQMGLEADAILGLNAAMNEASESSERAGTRLRRLTQQVMQPGAAEDFAEPLGLTAEGFNKMREENPKALLVELIKTFDDGRAAAEALQENLSSTSRQALAGLAQNADSVTEALGTASESFEKGQSLQEEFALETEKTKTQQQLLRSEIENIKRNLGSDLLPAFKSTIGVVSDVVSAFSDLNKATDGAAAKVGLFGAIVGGTGAALLTLVSGPVAAVIGGLAALGTAYATNLGGIRDTTSRVLSDVKEIWGRTMGETGTLVTSILGRIGKMIGLQLDDSVSKLDIFVTSFAQGLDVVAAGFVTLLDAALTAGDVVQDTLAGAAKAANQVRLGNLEKASGIAQQALERPGEGISGFLDRTGRRVAGLRRRQQARKRALATGDLSLLPSASEEESETSRQSSGGDGDDEFDSEAVAEAFADAFSSTRGTMEEKLDEILNENERTAGALEGSALVQSDSRCDISEALLNPLESAPRPTAGAESAGGSNLSASEQEDLLRRRNTTVRRGGGSNLSASEQEDLLRRRNITVELNVDGRKLAEENRRAARKFIDRTRVTE